MVVLRKELCALKFRKMHTKSEKISKFYFISQENPLMETGPLET